MRSQLWLCVAMLAACGGDDDTAGQTKPNAPAGAVPTQAKVDDKNKLKPRMHIEDKVVCAVPDKPSGPLCEPLTAQGSAAPPAGQMLADCDPGLYCLQVGTAYSCEPCRERDIIRHEFRDRDFALDQARDPFFSYTIAQPGVGQTTNTPKTEPHQTCKREDQFVALNYSFQDLKLVGIVSQGTQRKVLMMDSGNLGHIIKRGDCVGKEKAVVKDIGTGYITFVVEEDTENKRPAQEFSVQLHPGGLEAEPPPQSAPPPVPTTTAPIVTPEKADKPAPIAPRVPVVVPKK